MLAEVFLLLQWQRGLFDRHAKLPQRLVLDLPDPFLGQPDEFANLRQGSWPRVGDARGVTRSDAESMMDHFLLDLTEISGILQNQMSNLVGTVLQLLKASLLGGVASFQIWVEAD